MSNNVPTEPEKIIPRDGGSWTIKIDGDEVSNLPITIKVGASSAETSIYFKPFDYFNLPKNTGNGNYPINNISFQVTSIAVKDFDFTSGDWNDCETSPKTNFGIEPGNLDSIFNTKWTVSLNNQTLGKIETGGDFKTDEVERVSNTLNNVALVESTGITVKVKAEAVPPSGMVEDNICYTWQPDPATICEKVKFTQTKFYKSGAKFEPEENREALGEHIPMWGNWLPDPSTICKDIEFVQKRTDLYEICPSESQRIIGTSIPYWSPWAPDTSTICDGIPFTQTKTDLNGVCGNITREAMGTAKNSDCNYYDY